MNTIRKIVDSNALSALFELPPAFKNRKVEVVMFPLEEKEGTPKNNIPQLTMAQIDEWAKTPEIQVLVGSLKGSLPEDLSIKTIRNERIAETISNEKGAMRNEQRSNDKRTKSLFENIIYHHPKISYRP